MVRLVWGLLGLGCILIATAFVETPSIYLDWRPAVLVIGVMVSFTFTRHSLDAVFRGILHGVADEATIAAIRTMRSTTHAAGGLRLLMALVAVMAPSQGPNLDGQAIQPAILAPIYAVFVAELLIAPILHRRIAQQHLTNA